VLAIASRRDDRHDAHRRPAPRARQRVHLDELSQQLGPAATGLAKDAAACLGIAMQTLTKMRWNETSLTEIRAKSFLPATGEFSLASFV